MKKVLSAKCYVLSKKPYLELFDCIKRNWLLVIIVAAAFVLHMVVIWPSGMVRCIEGVCGMHLWGAHEHDGIWHVALINSSFRQIPFIFPTFSGASLSGYNFLLDIVLWIFTLLGFTAWDLYFRIQPTVWFVFFSTILYLYSQSIRKDKTYTILVFFVMFFASSFGFIIQYFKNGNVWGSSGNPTMQSALSMTNPQFMWSIALLLLLAYILFKKKNKIYVLALVFLIAGLKIYAVIPLVIIVGSYTVLYLFKKDWKNALITTLSSFIALAIAYIIFYSGNSNGGIFFDPIAIPKQMIEDPNMWHMPDLVSLWYPLSSSGSIGPKLIWVCAQIIGYFLFFNYGMRLLGIVASFYYVVSRKSHISFHAFVWTVIVLFCSLMPILFIQSGDWWNTIQFMYFGFIFGNLLLAETIYLAWHKIRPLAIILIMASFLAFIPAQVDLVRTFALGGSSVILDSELVVLEKLKNMPDGIVLTQPFEKDRAGILSEMYDTAYVTAISRKQVYFADIKQLELLNVDYKKRLETLQLLQDCNIDSKIRYIYLKKNVDSYQRYHDCIKLLETFTLVEDNSLVSLYSRLEP